MYEEVKEKISVAGIYDKAVFTPKKFKWKLRDYPIEQITLVSELRDGGVKKRMYSVMSAGNLYRLCFNRDSEAWILEAVWNEG